AALRPQEPNVERHYGNAVENAFAKLKASLRKAAERSVEGLWNTIGRITDTFTPTECANYFAAAGYDAA
ncbi:hypothetical protein EBE87_24055, partial [Pseudoroseomonas wenyumeiae]